MLNLVASIAQHCTADELTNLPNVHVRLTLDWRTRTLYVSGCAPCQDSSLIVDACTCLGMIKDLVPWELRALVHLIVATITNLIVNNDDLYHFACTSSAIRLLGIIT